MKSRVFIISLLALSSLLCALSNLEAQVPQGFNYQAIARDGSGNPITGATIKVKLSILSDTTGFYSGTGGVYVWEEEHTNVKTNSFGMFTVVLGSPAAVKIQGSATSFSAIDWSPANLFVGTKIANPSDYKVMGSAKLWSVPYALRSNTSESEKWLQSGANIYHNAGKVGIWTSNPQTALTVTENNNTGITFPLYIQNASNDWTATEKGVGLKFGRINPTSGHDYGTIRGTIASGTNGSVGRLQFTGGPGTDPHMTIDYTGNVGIGTVSPSLRLHTSGSEGAPATSGTAQNGSLRLGVGHLALDFGTLVSPAWGAWMQATNITNLSLNYNLLLNPNGGNIGIGTTTPADKLHVNGGITAGSLVIYNPVQTTLRLYKPDNPVDQRISEFISTGTNFVGRFVNDAYNAADHWLTVTRNTGTFTVNSVLISGGNFGVGTNIPSGRAEIQAPATWPDDVPLFQVKNKLGVPVMAVYNNGVRILVEDTDGKGVKGGFAIGGFDPTKAPGAETVNLMMVHPDSVRFNIDNNTGKGVKGGFAIGSFDASKVVNPREFMQVMPQSSYSGSYNTFIGYEAGKNMKGPHNTVIGKKAGYSMEGNNAAANIFIGEGAGMNNYGGYDSYFQQLPDGSWATLFNSYGGENVAIGYYSGVQLYGDALNKSYGKRNVLMGAYSGFKLKEGRENTLIGYSAGSSLTTGHGNVFIGYYAGAQETGNSKLYIDNSNTTTPLIYGDFVSNFLLINGSLEVTGEAFKPGGGTWSVSSDIRLKDLHGSFDAGLSEILNLEPYYFNYKTDNARNHNPEKEYVGFVAQDVQKYLPEAVSEGSDGYMNLDMHVINVALVNAVKEQQKEIEELRRMVQELQSIVAGNR